jgi:hypothetical protein
MSVPWNRPVVVGGVELPNVTQLVYRRAVDEVPKVGVEMLVLDGSVETEVAEAEVFEMFVTLRLLDGTVIRFKAIDFERIEGEVEDAQVTEGEGAEV